MSIHYKHNLVNPTTFLPSTTRPLLISLSFNLHKGLNTLEVPEFYVFLNLVPQFHLVAQVVPEFGRKNHCAISRPNFNFSPRVNR
jgi:hypothetical protein